MSLALSFYFYFWLNLGVVTGMLAELFDVIFFSALFSLIFLSMYSRIYPNSICFVLFCICPWQELLLPDIILTRKGTNTINNAYAFSFPHPKNLWQYFGSGLLLQCSRWWWPRSIFVQISMADDSPIPLAKRTNPLKMAVANYLALVEKMISMVALP